MKKINKISNMSQLDEKSFDMSRNQLYTTYMSLMIISRFTI